MSADDRNHKLLAQRLPGVDDAAPVAVMAEMTRLFSGYEGLAGLYVIEDMYREQAVVALV